MLVNGHEPELQAFLALPRDESRLASRTWSLQVSEDESDDGCIECGAAGERWLSDEW